VSKKIAAQKQVLAAIQAGLFSVDESSNADALGLILRNKSYQPWIGPRQGVH
jgi:hypothetical protein